MVGLAPVIGPKPEKSNGDRFVFDNGANSVERAVPASSTSASKQSLRHVYNLFRRAAIIKWMKAEARKNCDKQIPSRAARQFPQFFVENEKLNLQKAFRRWKQRAKIVTSIDTYFKSMTSLPDAKWMKAMLKAKQQLRPNRDSGAVALRVLKRWSLPVLQVWWHIEGLRNFRVGKCV